MENEVNGIQLVPRNISFPVLAMLSDPNVLGAYQEGIKSYGSKARKTLDVLSYPDGVLKGSNPFAVVELGKTQRLITPSELELGVSINPDYFRGTYEDAGLVLRSEGDTHKPNDYIAKNLAEQVKRRVGGTVLNHPVRISLNGLGLKEDTDSTYGLSFIIGDSTEVIAVPELSYENNQRKFSRTDERGVPIFEDNGNRTFYAREQGVSGLYLDRNLVLDSSNENLAGSYGDGRVVVVNNSEGVSQNFLNELSGKLQIERDQQIADIQERYAKADKILRGKQ